MNNTLPVVNAHNGWSRLEEVWLGDVYPCSWYDHLAPEVRDTFYALTEKTQEDLAVIQRRLEEFGVKVRRPVYDNIDNYLDPTGQLTKPEISPRDSFAAIGNTFFMPHPQLSPRLPKTIRPWQHIIDEYASQGIEINKKSHARWFTISGANIVRAGRDLYIDTHYTFFERGASQSLEQEEFEKNYARHFSGQRVHFLNNGGHIDGCFAVLKPGLILCNEYFSEYDKTFPGWKLIRRFSPEFFQHPNIKYRPGTSPRENRKWWLPDLEFPKAFNKHVIQHAIDWVGDYTETYFEVNCLSIDEKNVMVLGENEPLFRELEQQGITAHPVPFRCRTFWDGGLHCITLDIRRQSKLEDYFPERDSQSLIFY